MKERNLIDVTTATERINLTTIYLVAAIIILSSLIVGHYGTVELGDYSEEEIEGESEDYAEILSIHIADELEANDNAAKAMAQIPQLANALINGSESNIKTVDPILDLFKISYNSSLCYLMNSTGITIASSNRDSPSSLVGNNYSFRPYFIDAIQGNAARYFALGVTTGKRGYYSGYPVRGQNGSILGVAVIKIDLDYLEADLTKYDYTMIVSPQGVIFLSCHSNLINYTMGRPDQETLENITQSKQFGDGPFTPFIDEKPRNGDEVEIDGEQFLVTIKVINADGWSVYVFHSLEERRSYMWVGVIISLLVIAVFIGIMLYFINLRKSELHLQNQRNQAQMYLDIAGSIMVVLNTDQTIALINKRGCEVLGYEEKDLLGKNWFDTVIPEPARDHIKTIFNRLMNGEIHSLEYHENLVTTSSGEENLISWRNSVIKDSQGMITGTLSSGKDITKQKMGEEIIRGHNIFMEKILDSLTHPFYVINLKDYSFAMCNQAARDAGKKGALTCHEMTHDNPEPCNTKDNPCPIEIVKRTKKPVVVEHVHYDDKGNSRNMEVHGYPLFNEKGEISQMIEYSLDITHKKKVERALQESEEIYRTLIENAEDYIFLNDREGTILSVNRRVADFYNCKKEDIIGKSIFDIFSKEVAEHNAQNIKEVFDSGEPIAITHQREVEGNIQWLSAILSPVKDQDGNVTSVVGISRDITEQKEAEELLMVSEEKFRVISDTAQDAIFRMDHEGNIQYMNDSAERMFGHSFFDIMGKNLHNLLSPERYRSIQRKAFNTFVETGRGNALGHTTELYGLRSDGIEFPMELSLSSVFSKGKWNAIGIIRDISERKESEEKLIESEERYRDLFDNARDMIQMVTPDGKIEYVNDEWRRTLGYDTEDIPEMSIWTIVCPDEKPHCKEIFGKILSSEDVGLVETEFISKDGRRIQVEGSVSCRFEDGRPVSTRGIFRDVSERKMMEKERERLIELLKEKGKELQQVVYVTSHDLRSPMVNIQGFSEQLKHSCMDIFDILKSESLSDETSKRLQAIKSEDVDESLRYIRASIDKMDSMINGLLKISRLGTVSLDLQTLDVTDMLHQIQGTFEYRLQEQEATLEIGDLPPCYGDSNKINQVFSNLIDNALKYGDPEKEGKITIRGEAEGDQVIYSVEDNGLGIPDKHTSKVFQIFHRVGGSKEKGEGLGLAAVKRIIDRHNGRIWVESEFGKGSIFFFSLPQIDGNKLAEENIEM